MADRGVVNNRNRSVRWLLASVAATSLVLVVLVGLVVHVQAEADAQRRSADEQAARMRRQEFEVVRGGLDELRNETGRRDSLIVQLMKKPPIEMAKQPVVSKLAHRSLGRGSSVRSSSRIKGHPKPRKPSRVVCDINDPLCGIEDGT